METGAVAPMPQYQSHKKVWALKIASVEDLGDDGTTDENPRVRVHFADTTFAPCEFNLRGKPTPEAGYYMVRYEDGYVSFSPGAIFEAAHTKIASVGRSASVGITVGRIVLYTLSEDDAKQINRRRTTGSKIAERIQKNSDEATHWPLGAQAHIGNTVEEGEIYPMVVTRIWSANCVNGQVLLDGNDCLWATSVTEGTRPRTWAWPTRN